jgi:regulatory protein
MTDLDACYTAALRILNYRFNSEAELRKKLRTKKFEAEDIDSTIERLRREKWLDDERFAGAFTRTRARRHVGRMRIKRELGAAGVSSEAIERAVAENVDADEERATAEALAKKKWAVLIRRNEPAAARQKVGAFLQRQGYEFALVIEIVARLRTK